MITTFILTITSAALALVPAASASFTDINLSANAEAVLFMQSEGIVEGYSNGSFKPKAHINRAEFTKIIVEANFTDEQIANCDVNNTITFTDVAQADWYAKYVCTAKVHGLIEGYSDNTFQPAATINYAESAKILVQAYDVSTQGETNVWYNQYINAMNSVEGAANVTLEPASLVNREQMAQLVFNLESRAALMMDTSSSAMSESSSSSVVVNPDDEPMIESNNGAYLDYTDGVIGNGEMAVLFFYSSSCQSCREHDAVLTAAYAVGDIELNTYKVNYDNSAELQAQYEVKSEDTFVVINGNGDVQAKSSFPTEATVLSYIQADL